MRISFDLRERRSPLSAPKDFAGRRTEQRVSLENPSISLTDPRAWAQVFGEWRSAADVAVDVDVAMSVPAIWCAVTFLSNTVASLPLRLHRKSVNGRETIDTGALAELVSKKANEDGLTSFKWRRRVMASTLLKGRGPTFVERNAAGDTRNLWPLDMAYTTVKRVKGKVQFVFKQPSPPKTFTYDAGEVLDLEFLGALDGVSHFDPIAALKDAIGLTVALERYGSKFFGNGGVPPLAMEGPGASPAAIARAKDDIGEAVRETNAGGDNVLYVPLPHKLTPIGFDPEKGQMIEVRRFQVEETSRIYNLPPAFLHNLERATFGNVEQQDLNLVKHCIVHWVEQIEQEANVKMFESAKRRYLEFDLNGLLRGDLVARMAAYASAVQNAIMKPQEVRRRENLPDAPGGDQLFMQSTVQPIGAPEPASDGNPEVDPVDDPA